MRIMAIDPGSTESAYVIMEGYRPVEFAKISNNDLIQKISFLDAEHTRKWPEAMAIEMVASYGMPVGKEVFDTCVWVGRFWQECWNTVGVMPELVYRMEEKMTLCHDSKAKDSNIRQALIDRFAQHDRKNGKGTKTNPDWFYGFSADVWSAYAVGVTFLDKQQEKIMKR